MDAFLRRGTATAASLALATTVALAMPAAPAAAAPSAPAAASSEMMTALQRDLGLSAEQAQARLATQDAAARTEQELRAELGVDFGGAWLTADDQRLVVAITDEGLADEVRAAGAVPRVVARNERELDSTRARLDRAPAPADVASWYVDVTANQVVVLAQPSAMDAAAEFVAASGADPDAVRVEASTERPVPLYDVRGGDAYYFGGGSRCSVGFSVNGGFVTAGHCGGAGTPTSGFNQVAQGTVAGSSFPGNDYGWVAVNANWSPTPMVNRYAAGHDLYVTGAQVAPVGAAVCRSGSTTQWRCGIIEATGVTVNYVEGTVHGLTRTTACAQPGDSGGPFVAGDQAQGVTSGGSGNCATGGIIYFQPLQPILAAFGLGLVSAGTPPYTVARTAITQSGHRNPDTAIANGRAANRSKILAVGINCTYWADSSRFVWGTPDSSWYIFDVTTTAYCTN